MVLDKLLGRSSLLLGDIGKSFFVHLAIQILFTFIAARILPPRRCPRLVSRLKLL
uniref:Serine/threonine-protein kinase 38-like n=1 Tax=Rhizophora mucronata TaxID=61149 RepID=A0A2P2IKF7_RHIMU